VYLVGVKQYLYSKMHGEIRINDWIYLAEDRDKRRAVANMAMNFFVTLYSPCILLTN
jgi:hypothetical protein